MISNESDARFYVAKSTIKGAGKGLFAKTVIAKGDKLEVLGVLVPAKSLADRCTIYADAYKFRIGKYLLIPTGLGGIANHSDTPNVGRTYKHQIGTGEFIEHVALVDIPAETELFVKYACEPWWDKKPTRPAHKGYYK